MQYMRIPRLFEALVGELGLRWLDHAPLGEGVGFEEAIEVVDEAVSRGWVVLVVEPLRLGGLPVPGDLGFRAAACHADIVDGNRNAKWARSTLATIIDRAMDLGATGVRLTLARRSDPELVLLQAVVDAGIQPCGTDTVSAVLAVEDAVRVIDALAQHRVPVWGLDAFICHDDGGHEPDQYHDIDFGNAPAASYDEVMEALRGLALQGVGHVEIVV